MEQLKRKIIVSVILSMYFTIYSHAFTPPSNVLDKQVSYIERNGLEYTLRDDVSLTVDEFFKFALNKEAALEWEDGGGGNYILLITLNDILTKYTNITKILFTDRKNKDHVLMNRIIYNQEEISGYNKLTLIKQWTTGAVLEKRKAHTGTYEQKRDMSHITQYWEGGQMNTNVQEEKYFEFTEKNAVKQVKNTGYFQRLKQTYKNLILFIEEKSENYIYLYLGFDEGGHTTRHAFVRVDLLGAVEYTPTPPEDENSWKLML